MREAEKFFREWMRMFALRYRSLSEMQTKANSRREKALLRELAAKNLGNAIWCRGASRSMEPDKIVSVL